MTEQARTPAPKPNTPDPTPIVATEMAVEEFDRFADMMGLDVDTADMDSEDAAQLGKLRTRLIKAIECGALVINENGEAVYTPRNRLSKHQDPITFHERTGASLMAMDGKKRGHDVAKMYAILADMCRVHPSVFAGLAGVDVKTCEALFALLMD